MDISSVSRREVLRYLGYKGKAEPDQAVADEIEPVSYTHLTLPTILLV